MKNRLREQSELLCKVAVMLMCNSRIDEAIDCLRVACFVDPTHEGASEAMRALLNKS